MQFKESSFWQYSISHIAICAKTLAITSLGNWPTPSFHCWTCVRLRDHLSNSWALVLWQTHELPRSVGFDLRIWCSAVIVTVTRVQGRITGHCAFRPVRYIETLLAKWCKSLILSLHIYLRECPSDRRVCSRTIYSYTFRHKKAATEKCWRKPVIKRTSSCSLSVRRYFSGGNLPRENWLLSRRCSLHSLIRPTSARERHFKPPSHRPRLLLQPAVVLVLQVLLRVLKLLPWPMIISMICYRCLKERLNCKWLS